MQNIVEWEVESDRGVRKFMTRSLNETEGGFMITDQENNRYEIRDRFELDPRSAAILARKI